MTELTIENVDLTTQSVHTCARGYQVRINASLNDGAIKIEVQCENCEGPIARRGMSTRYTNSRLRLTCGEK